MRLDTYAKSAADQYLSNDDLALIRKTAVEMAGDVHTIPVGTVLLKLLNHINLVTADKADMVDVLALQEKLTDRETRLRAMEKAFFELVVERDRLREKLGVRI
jgi:hypothetical protein